MVAIFVVVTITALLGLIQIGSSVVFNDVISLVVEGFFSSYLCVLLPLLYHRIKGNITVCDEDCDFETDKHSSRSAVDRAVYAWGPWRVPEPFGTINNAFACCYIVAIGFFSFWPPGADVTPKNMNFSVLLLGGIAVLSALYYLLWARRTFTGPIMEVYVDDVVGTRKGLGDAKDVA